MAKINVLILDSTGNKEQEACLPDDAPINRVLGKLIQMLNLPAVGPDGQPMSYKFHHKASGKQLSGDETLAQAGVKENDVLRLQPEITAGRQSA